MTSPVEAASAVLSRCSVRPSVGMILGSGLGAAAGQIQDPMSIPYAEIPGFPGSDVPGHRGELVIGTLDGRGVAAMMGRVHLYEGWSPAEVAFPVAFLNSLGVRLLMVTNAAGGLKPGTTAGTLMILEDHINLPGLAGMNPLIGRGGGSERFVSMEGAYDPGLRDLALAEAQLLGLRVDTGVYVMVAGPSYETPAEARFLRQIGADAVGMSTVPEVVMARSLGMRVLGVSCITNTLLDGGNAEGTAHSAVLSVAEEASRGLALLLRAVLRRVEGLT